MTDAPYRTAAPREKEPRQLEPEVQMRLALDAADLPRGRSLWFLGALAVLGVAAAVMAASSSGPWILAVALLWPLASALRLHWMLHRKRQALLAEGFELEDRAPTSISAADEVHTRVHADDVHKRIDSPGNEYLDAATEQEDDDAEVNRKMSGVD